jgi:hypothetical protein
MNLSKWFALVYFIPFAITLFIWASSYEADRRAAARQETTTGRIVGWSWNHSRIIRYAFKVNGQTIPDNWSSLNPLPGNAPITVYYDRSYPSRNSSTPFAVLEQNDCYEGTKEVSIAFLMGVVASIFFLRLHNDPTPIAKPPN